MLSVSGRQSRGGLGRAILSLLLTVALRTWYERKRQNLNVLGHYPDRAHVPVGHSQLETPRAGLQDENSWGSTQFPWAA